MYSINPMSSLKKSCIALEEQLTNLNLLNSSKKTSIKCFDTISTLQREVDDELKKIPIDRAFGDLKDTFTYNSFLELTELNDRIGRMSTTVVKKIESASIELADRDCDSKGSKKIIKLSEHLFSADFPLTPSKLEKLVDVKEYCEKQLEKSQKRSAEPSIPKPYTNVIEMYANDWLAVESLQGVHCFNVLSQLRTVGGHNACGFHAIKNAALALAFFYNCGDKPALIKLLSDNKFFENEFYPFINKEALHADLSLAEIESSLKRLKQSSAPSLQPLVRVLKAYPNSISILLSSSGKLTNPETSVEDVVKLYKKFETEGPWVHAVISGSGDHWLVLILLKTDDGECHWFSLNSYKDVRDVTLNHKREIEGALLNRKESLYKTFNHTFGHFLEIKRKNFNEKGKVDEADYVFALLDSKEENIRYLKSAFSFLHALNLINDPAYEDQLDTMKRLSEFYTSMFSADDEAIIMDLQDYLEVTRICEAENLKVKN